MFTYYCRLALLSVRRTPIVAGLMISAIALGVGLCVITLTVYRLMSGNPIENRNDVLYSVTLDSWDPKQPADDEHPTLPPPQLTYRDAMAVTESPIPARHVMMYKTAFAVDSGEADGRKPYVAITRLTTKDFFAMFDAPFEFGSGWDQAADDGAQPVVVLSHDTNVKAFGGGNSVGKTLHLNARDYKVIGVLRPWKPTPLFYDLNNGALNDPEALFVPLSVGIALEASRDGNTNCWKQQAINSMQDFLGSECVWLQVWVELTDRAQFERFRDFLDNYVHEQKKLGRFERPLNNRLAHPDEWLKVNEVVRNDNRVLVGIAFMFLGVCLLNMIGLMLAKFLGAAPLVGLRRALGASRRSVFFQHLVEVGAVGLAGGILGFGVAALGLAGVRHLYTGYEALTHLDVAMAFIAVSIAVVSGVVAGLYPTWRIGRVSPASYLKVQ
jgi:putative ABC transport system permease protein